ncbi:MAG: FG-GAP-like repeat-containing protein [Phycisphaerales bacterium]
MSSSSLCAAQTSPQFSDQTFQANIDCVFVGGFMLGSAAAGDFDQDGDQDLFLAGGDHTDQLLINDGTGSFENRAAAWGVDRTHPTGGAAVGDYNNDGYPDIFVASQSNKGHSLYRNNQDGTFTDVARDAGVWWTSSTDIADGFGAAFGDYDLDGDLDLAVAGWDQDTRANRVFRNNNDGTFTVVSSYTDPNAPVYFPRRNFGFTPRWHDMDNDLYPELLLVSDFGTTGYFRNNRDGTLTNTTADAKVGDERNGMGQAVGDLNNDGLPDWYVTSIETQSSGNMLYINQGDHRFVESSVAAGVRNGAWGWGAVAVDIDHDSDLDLVATNGWNGWDSPSYLFLNDGTGTSFTEAAESSGLDHTEQGRGLIRFDADLDGDQDLLFSASGSSPTRFFRNDLDQSTSNWSRISLDTQSHPRLAPNGVGTRVELTDAGVTMHRWIDNGSSYISQSEMTGHFGWPADQDASIDQVRVYWTNGTVTTIQDLPSNTHITISACAADDNLDGIVTPDDVYSFIGRFMARERAADLGAPFGRTDFFDVVAYINAYSAGCP